MVENPIIEISILSTTETKQTKQDLLEIVKERYQRTHHVDIYWTQTGENPRFIVKYPSYQRFLECYSMGYMVYLKLFEDLSLDRAKYGKICAEAMAKRNPTNEFNIDNNYIVIKYQTNCMQPMRENYQFSANLAAMIGAIFCIEEVEDGFIFFYKRRDDFLGFQVDVSNYEEVKNWFLYIDINIEDPSILGILNYIKNSS